MRFFVSNFKWVMLIAGLLTCTMFKKRKREKEYLPIRRISFNSFSLREVFTLTE